MFGRDCTAPLGLKSRRPARGAFLRRRGSAWRSAFSSCFLYFSSADAKRPVLFLFTLKTGLDPRAYSLQHWVVHEIIAAGAEQKPGPTFHVWEDVSMPFHIDILQVLNTHKNSAFSPHGFSIPRRYRYSHSEDTNTFPSALSTTAFPGARHPLWSARQLLGRPGWLSGYW